MMLEDFLEFFSQVKTEEEARYIWEKEYGPLDDEDEEYYDEPGDRYDYYDWEYDCLLMLKDIVNDVFPCDDEWCRTIKALYNFLRIEFPELEIEKKLALECKPDEVKYCVPEDLDICLPDDY